MHAAEEALTSNLGYNVCRVAIDYNKQTILAWFWNPNSGKTSIIVENVFTKWLWLVNSFVNPRKDINQNI